jgi:Ca-activated chloride channel family protein
MIDSLSLHFIRPWWLLALPLAVLLPWAWRRLRRPSGDWARICDPHLLRWLSVEQGGSASGRGGPLWAGLAIALAALALAGPSWQKLPDTSFSARDARVIVLDLSASMLAEDLKPNRLTRVRFRLSDLLAELQEGQLGLVAFAGDAYIVSPLTSDMNTVANMLPALQPNIMPVAGSRADRGMETAAELLSRAGLATGEILLITDSVSAADIDTAERLAQDGVRTSVLAVGTPKGAPIPSGSGFVSDADGGVVIVRLQADSLRQLAAAGGGRFSILDAGGPVEELWPGAAGVEFEQRDDAVGERWKDAGPWLVLLLLPLMAVGFRRGLLFLLPLTVVPALSFSPTVQAGFWDDLWHTRDQQAQAALAEQKPDTAAMLARDPLIAGEAWFRAEDFERASQAWSGLPDADAHYNRGNALAHNGDLEEALGAYDEALAIDPEMEDALFNRALVEQMLEQQQQQQDQEASENQEGESSEQQDQQGQEQEQEGEGEESQQEPQEGEADPSQRSEQDLEATWSEEDAQAMEQWLRRIPDDPGGLLRRKFRSQHQKRGAPEDEEKTW